MGPWRSTPTEANCSYCMTHHQNHRRKTTRIIISSPESYVFSVVIWGQFYLSFYFFLMKDMINCKLGIKVSSGECLGMIYYSIVFTANENFYKFRKSDRGFTVWTVSRYTHLLLVYTNAMSRKCHCDEWQGPGSYWPCHHTNILPSIVVWLEGSLLNSFWVAQLCTSKS